MTVPQRIELETDFDDDAMFLCGRFCGCAGCDRLRMMCFGPGARAQRRPGGTPGAEPGGDPRKRATL